MKRKIIAVLLGGLMLAGLFAGCTNTDNGSASADKQSPTESESYNLSDEMKKMTDQLTKTNDSASIDLDTLNSFFSSVAKAKYTVRGVASNYNCSEYNGYTIAMVTLTNNDVKYMVSLAEKDKEIKDGEYLEVQGVLGTGISADMQQGYATFSLSKAEITDRGDAVKAKMK